MITNSRQYGIWFSFLFMVFNFTGFANSNNSVETWLDDSSENYGDHFANGEAIHPLGKDRSNDLEYYRIFKKEQKDARGKYYAIVAASTTAFLSIIFAAPAYFAVDKAYKSYYQKNRFVDVLIASYHHSTQTYMKKTEKVLDMFYKLLLKRDKNFSLSKQQVLEVLQQFNVVIGLSEDLGKAHKGYPTTSKMFRKFSHAVLRYLDDLVLINPKLSQGDNEFGHRWYVAMTTLLREEKNYRNKLTKVVILDWFAQKQPKKLDECLENLNFLKKVSTTSFELGAEELQKMAKEHDIFAKK